MVFTALRYWVTGEMVTVALLNAQLSANMDVLSTHQHTGAAGDGNDELSGVDFINMDQVAFSFVAGRLQRRAGGNLFWGASAYRITNEDPVAATAGLRSLISTPDANPDHAMAGNHTH